MPRCPTCDKQWPAEFATCPDDGSTLLTRPAAGDDSDEPTEVADALPPMPQVTGNLGPRISSSPKGGSMPQLTPLPDQAIEVVDSEELAVGTKVGEFMIEGKIGEGGMGTVYAASHPLIGKKAAVKVIKRSLGYDRGSVQRFMQEARSVNQIGHPNIVDVFSFGNLPDGRSYFVMEWLQGQVLADSLREGPLAIAEAVNILDQIADALEAAHEKGIVHRDLKPENVYLVQARGRRQVKLLDFGIAKLAHGDRVGNTRTGMIMGTPGYLSPEQARGRNVDHRTDIYALGCMGYELLTGRLPFEGDNAMDIIAAHLAEPPPRASSLWPDIPPALDDLIIGMLEKSAGKRPVLADIRVELQRLHRGLAGDRDSSSRRAAAAAPAAPVEVADPPPSRTAPAAGVDSVETHVTVQQSRYLPAEERRPRRRMLWLGAGLLAVVGASAAVVAQVQKDDVPLPDRTAGTAAPAAAAGMLVVRVNTPDARVEVDGEVVAAGASMARVRVDADRDHRLAVSAPGHRSFTRTIQVEAGEVLEVPIVLEPEPVATAATPDAGAAVVTPLAEPARGIAPSKKTAETPARKREKERYRRRHEPALPSAADTPAEATKPPETPPPPAEPSKQGPALNKETDYTINPFAPKPPKQVQ